MAVVGVVLVSTMLVSAIVAWPSAGEISAQWVSADTGASAPTPPAPAPAPPPSHRPHRPVGAPPQLRSPAVVEDDFVTWAILDRQTGQFTGSDNLAQTSTTASMIKVWLVADYLRRLADGAEPSQERLDQLTLIIRDSNNSHAQTLFAELGSHESIERLIDICGLTDSSPVPWRWSYTQLSARDTARMGACIADGTAAGEQWTGWLLDEMRAVRGLGDFGIRHAFPPEQRSAIAIKNGWVIRTESDEYHVNCLAIGDGWTMGVLTRYPAQLGYQHGAEICRSLAAQHLR